MECLPPTSVLSILAGCARFTQHPAVQANPLAVLGLGLVSGQLVVLQLHNLTNVPLAIWSLQHTSVTVRASVGMRTCSLELLSGVEAV